ncbi:MAG: Smr/MutS family protein [Chromatiaceae bacterium]|nr:Smr/MutS family protein [Chromatiaceae bacterium]
MSQRLPDAESQLFRAEVRDTEPLTLALPEPWRRRPPPFPIAQPLDALADEEVSSLSEAQVETHEYLLYAKPGVQKRILADLQRGAIPRELELDLHGLTVVFAAQLCKEFLADCIQHRVRCAHIIHGKGYGSEERQPVLKRKVNYWLRLRSDVLAFCSATPREGGTGALYVLLRNPDKARREAKR